MDPSLCIIVFVEFAEFSDFFDSASLKWKTRLSFPMASQWLDTAAFEFMAFTTYPKYVDSV